MMVVWFPGSQPDDKHLSAVIRAGHPALVGGPSATQWLLTEAAARSLVIIGGGVADLDRLPVKPRRWLAWDLYGEPNFANAALSAGALAVLPLMTTGDDLRRLAGRLGTDSQENSTPKDRRYRATSLVSPEADTMLEVVEGVVARVAVHAEGDEAVLNLHGPGDLAVVHPVDDCYIHLVAVTDIVIRAWPWDGIDGIPALTERLRSQLLHAESWAAVCARPTVKLRLLGLLAHIANRFGKDSPRGRFIPFRLSHGFLASAIGATRSTVSRSMAALVRDGRVCYHGQGVNRRIVLTQSRARTTSHA